MGWGWGWGWDVKCRVTAIQISLWVMEYSGNGQNDSCTLRTKQKLFRFILEKNDFFFRMEITPQFLKITHQNLSCSLRASVTLCIHYYNWNFWCCGKGINLAVGLLLSYFVACCWCIDALVIARPQCERACLAFFSV